MRDGLNTIPARACLLALMLSLAVAACGESAPAPSVGGIQIKAQLVRSFRDGNAPARELAFSADGSLLATSSAAGRITLRSMPGLRVVARMHHPDGVASLALSSDGTWLATGGYDRTVRLWSVPTGKPIRVLAGSGGTVWTVAISPDGRLVASAGEDKIVRLWDAATGRPLRALHGHSLNIWRIRFSADGRQLASGGFDRSIRIWDVASGKQVREILGHKQAVVGLAYSNDGRFLASSGDDSTIRIWQSSTGTPVRILQHGNHAYTLSFSPDGRWLVSGGRAHGAIGTLWQQIVGTRGASDSVRIWRVADGALVRTLQTDDDVASVALSPDGGWLAAATESSENKLWKLTASRS
jgi:WD40 repeat protein